MSYLTRINLDRTFFSEKEKLIAESGHLKAFIYLYDSGVHGLRIENALGYIETLPYQGQQIWRCNLLGRELSMDSMFDKPVKTSNYLENYGGFLLHCGATAMGVPSESDDHPLHGELPNARYEEAYLTVGEDKNGKFMALGGRYHHREAFNSNYIARPQITIYESSSILDVSMVIENLKGTDVELMYMAHINFKPVDHSELVYSTDYDPEHVMVYDNIPSHMKAGSDMNELVDYMEQLKTKPDLHHKVDPKLPYDPEIVFFIKYKEDEHGDAHSMQVHPDGYADYVSHKPSQLKYGVRWICRTKDEDAMGLVLPATSGSRGYTREKALANVEILPAKQSVEFNMRLGILDPKQALAMREKIEAIKA
ncbi:MAG: DUF4432 family protein [Bacillota bacterium]|nr:DUF4432 family protein [Bacillota bacterium]HHT89943.1 DUF4432 family protein [Bacillota bacterium]